MILLRCHVHGFGKLAGCSLRFCDGLNLVFAANEGGKSTLQRFLVGLLYGPLRADLRIQRRLDPWVEQYKPWRGSEYGGTLWCRLADGREIEICRTFGKEDNRIEIHASTGEDITDQYEKQRNGEVLFARFHFGIPKELFESVGIIHENRVVELNSRETIRDRISNLAQSGDEELSIRQSLSRIQQALDSIGSERAPTKPYRQTLDQLQALESERKALGERRAQFHIWIEERSRLADEILNLENQLFFVQQEAATARWHEAASKIQVLEEIDSQIISLRAEMKYLDAKVGFPAEMLEELNQLSDAHERLSERLKDVRDEREMTLGKLAIAEKERMAVASYAPLASNGEDEKITEWFVGYLNLSLQKDGVQNSLARLQEEMNSSENEMSKYAPAIRDPRIDWQEKARAAAEDEQAATQKCLLLADHITQEKAAFSSLARSAWRWKILAGLLLLPAATPAVIRFFPEFGNFSYSMGLALSLIFGITATILLAVASKSAGKSREVKNRLQELESEQNQIQEEAGKKRKEIHQVMTDSGFKGIDDFLSAAKKSEQSRQRLAGLAARLAETEKQCDRMQKQCASIYQNLKDSLANVGLSCSPGNLKTQIDMLRVNLRRYREIDNRYGGFVQQASSLKLKEEELIQEMDLKSSRIQSILVQAGVDTTEAFRAECHKRDKLLELREKEASRSREFQRLCGSRTLHEWKSHLLELEEFQQRKRIPVDGSLAKSPVEGNNSSAPCLPYIAGLAEAEEEEKRLASLLSSTREEHARINERVNQAFQNYRSFSEVDEDIGMAELKLQGLTKNRRALGLALETIETLSRKQQEVLAPQLNAAVEQRFLRLCERRYEEVKIDPDFQVWVRESATGDLRSAEQLSRGTQDQLYFAIRFGILDLISNQEEPCPSLLDEPFAAYDHARLVEAFQILGEESGRRQLFLFTCRDDLRDLAQQQGANIIQMTDELP